MSVDRLQEPRFTDQLANSGRLSEQAKAGLSLKKTQPLRVMLNGLDPAIQDAVFVELAKYDDGGVSIPDLQRMVNKAKSNHAREKVLGAAKRVWESGGASALVPAAVAALAASGGAGKRLRAVATELGTHGGSAIFGEATPLIAALAARSANSRPIAALETGGSQGPNDDASRALTVTVENDIV